MRLVSFSLRGTRAQAPFAAGLDERRGATMVEILTIAMIMGTLVRVAIPTFQHVLLEARATEVIGDLEAVRVAVLDYHAEHVSWPRDGYTGEIPAGLAAYLPEGFRFEGAGYRLDWESWSLPNGLPSQPDPGVLLGISIVTDDAALGHRVVDLLGGTMASHTLGARYTFVIERM